MQCVSVMLLRSMQNTKELADAKAENDALRDDVAAGRRRLHIKQSIDQCVKLPPPPAWIMQLPDWQTPLSRIISPQRELILYQKTTGRNPEYIMSSADRVAHIDGQLIIIEQYTRFQRSINA